MSDKSRSNTPRKNKGRVFSLFLIGLLLFTGTFLLIAPETGLVEQVTIEDIRAILPGDDEPAEEVAGTGVVEPTGAQVNQVTRSDEAEEEDEREYSPSIVEKLEVYEEQNDTTITLSEVELKGDLLIATFTISNQSSNTIYFPFYGTNASFDDNGGSMFRELYSEGDAGYDQFPTIINPGSEVTGKIAYSPLLYQDKPFTIYIRNITFREVEAEWEPFSFYVNLNGDDRVEVTTQIEEE